jgi:hypothetical protein
MYFLLSYFGLIDEKNKSVWKIITCIISETHPISVIYSTLHCVEATICDSGGGQNYFAFLLLQYILPSP